MVRVLSVQSSVAYGHVGNSVASFALQRLGHEVWPVLTAHLSNHTGYPTWRGRVFAAGEVAEVVAGLEDLGVLGEVDAVLTGYLGQPQVAEVVLDVVARVRGANPAAVYCCDPVMGEAGRGLFVAPEIPGLLREQLVPRADVVTPNHFELDTLVGRRTRTLAEVLAAADAVRDVGPRVVLVTGVGHAATPDGHLDMVVLDTDGAWTLTTARLPLAVGGAGDLTAALFLAHLADTGAPERALAATAASVFAVCRDPAGCVPGTAGWCRHRRRCAPTGGIPRATAAIF